MELIGNRWIEHAVHNSNTIAANQGFMVDADGTLNHRLRGDTADRAIPVKAGVLYAGLDIELAKSTGTTGVTKVWAVVAKVQR